MPHDAIILGAGAAGCMAAIEAGKRGRRVLLIDNGKRIGGKIPISGGGRCNFTNRNADASHYLCSNPHFLKSALARFSAADRTGQLRRPLAAFFRSSSASPGEPARTGSGMAGSS